MERFKLTGDEIFITDRMVQLEGKLAPNGEKYSFDYYRKILAKLSPSEADLNNLDILDEKVFYKTLLKLFQGVIGQESFKDYKSLQSIKGLQFSIGDELIVDSQNDDLMLIVKVNEVLKEIMGFSGSILFKLGFITFEKVAIGSYQVKSVGQTYDSFLKFMKKANIRPIFSLSSHQTMQELVSTILLIGYKEEISYSKNGVPTSRVIRYDQRASILSDIFNNDIVLASLGNKILMLDVFLNQFYFNYKKDADYAQIGWALSKVLTSQIDRNTQRLFDLGMDYRFIESFRTRALTCMYNYLFGTTDYGSLKKGDDFGAMLRHQLADFLNSKGVSEGLNLQSIKNPLSDYFNAYSSALQPGLTLEMLYDIFATVDLDLSDYTQFFEQYDNFRISINLRQTGVVHQRFSPDSILRSSMDHVINIANFLSYMAKTYGGTSQKIRIYGYAMKRDGLGYKKDDKLVYYPEAHDVSTQDWKMPQGNLRYFELDFNKLDEFDYILFLGSFLADMQTFVVKTEGMAGNEFLFAFNAITGSIDIGDIYVTSRGEVKPCFLEDWKNGLKWADESAHEDLETMFTAIMGNFKRDNFMTIHKYQDIAVWRRICGRVSALEDFSTLIKK